MLSSQSQLISMTHNVKQLRMLVLFLDLMYNVLSMNQPQQPSPMVLTKKVKVNVMFSFLILVVVPLMSPYLQLKMVSLKSRQQMVTLTQVVKTSITELSTFALLISRKKLVLTLVEMHVPYVVSELNAKKPREFYLLLTKLKSNVKHQLMVKITQLQFLVLNLKNFALICSENVCPQLNKFLKTQI